jgi:hypothetical protein
MTTVNQQDCTLDCFLILGTTPENGYMENKDDEDNKQSTVALTVMAPNPCSYYLWHILHDKAYSIILIQNTTWQKALRMQRLQFHKQKFDVGNPLVRQLGRDLL